MRAAQGCFGAAQSFKNKAEKDNLRIYGLEGALVEEGEVFTRNRESSYRRLTYRVGILPRLGLSIMPVSGWHHATVRGREELFDE